ncbi:MAG: flagellar basal body-associated FliL family protein [Gammaproteobacteria bacterium]|nr:flagellar basal body-associated FliL family protein [Gammaproteobacteria bacterium]
MADNAVDGGNTTKLVAMMIVGAIVLVVVSMGGIFFLLKSMGLLNPGGTQAEAVSPDAPAIYHPLEPAFIVNFTDKGRSRYLQASVEIMTRDPHVIEALTAHMPLIRNNILLLLSSQTAETLHSPAGKEEIRKVAMEEINKILEEQSNTGGIEAVYFTSFVTQ